jgi:hypothetical protein
MWQNKLLILLILLLIRVDFISENLAESLSSFMDIRAFVN